MMSNLKEKNSIDRSREHLANERTFLAWIRTGIALMGFGFVIVKFSIFLQQLTLFYEIDAVESKEYSLIFGIFLVIVGVFIAILSFFQYKKNEKQLKRDFYVSFSMLSLFLLLVMIIGGVFLLFYLLSNIYFL